MKGSFFVAQGEGQGMIADFLQYNNSKIEGERVKAFSPASFLNPSNSMGLKLGLYKLSHIPRYSIVFLFRNQFPITAVGSSLLYLATLLSR